MKYLSGHLAYALKDRELRKNLRPLLKYLGFLLLEVHLAGLGVGLLLDLGLLLDGIRLVVADHHDVGAASTTGASR